MKYPRLRRGIFIIVYYSLFEAETATKSSFFGPNGANTFVKVLTKPVKNNIIIFNNAFAFPKLNRKNLRKILGFKKREGNLLAGLLDVVKFGKKDKTLETKAGITPQRPWQPPQFITCKKCERRATRNNWLKSLYVCPNAGTISPSTAITA